jgi:hypothetical protein
MLPFRDTELRSSAGSLTHMSHSGRRTAQRKLAAYPAGNSPMIVVSTTNACSSAAGSPAGTDWIQDAMTSQAITAGCLAPRSPPQRCAPSSRSHLRVSDRFRGSARRKSDGSCPTSGRSAQRSRAGAYPGFHAVSLRASPSHLSGLRLPQQAPALVTCPVTQKTLSLAGKGLHLRKLVAGAGFEPATSGL